MSRSVRKALRQVQGKPQIRSTRSFGEMTDKREKSDKTQKENAGETQLANATGVYRTDHTSSTQQAAGVARREEADG